MANTRTFPIIAALAAALPLAAAAANPQIHAGNMPKAGDQFPMGIFKMEATAFAQLIRPNAAYSGGYWNVGDSGTGRTWDYSGIAVDGSATADYVAPSSLANGDRFPGATFASGADGRYMFYAVESGKFLQVGEISQTRIMPYSKPQTLLTFPFGYGQSLPSYGESPFEYNGGSYLRIVQSACLADGHGTLKLPGGITHQNAIRLRIVTYTVDSLISGAGSTRRSMTWEYQFAVESLRPFVFTLMAFWDGKNPIEDDSKIGKMGFWHKQPAAATPAPPVSIRPIRPAARAELRPEGWVDVMGRAGSGSDAGLRIRILPAVVQLRN